MNWDQIAVNWKQCKGKVKERWGKLTDDDLTTIAGKRDQLSGLLQQKYGYAKAQAEKELDEFERTPQTGEGLQPGHGPPHTCEPAANEPHVGCAPAPSRGR